jgi:hypothetical protein
LIKDVVKDAADISYYEVDTEIMLDLMVKNIRFIAINLLQHAINLSKNRA